MENGTLRQLTADSRYGQKVVSGFWKAVSTFGEVVSSFWKAVRSFRKVVSGSVKVVTTF
jgi:hypothetical protein